MRSNKSEWHKVPSVTYGGKAHFYTRITEMGMERTKYTIIWDRQAKIWKARKESLSIGFKETYSQSWKTPKAGMNFINHLLA